MLRMLYRCAVTAALHCQVVIEHYLGDDKKSLVLGSDTSLLPLPTIFFGKTILFQVDRVISEPISKKRMNVAKNEEKKKTFKV